MNKYNNSYLLIILLSIGLLAAGLSDLWMQQKIKELDKRLLSQELNTEKIYDLDHRLMNLEFLAADQKSQ